MAAPFALAPGLIDVADVIAFNTDEGRALYKQATKNVYANKEEFYDGSADDLDPFLHLVHMRASEFGWGENGILEKNGRLAGIVVVNIALAGGDSILQS